MSGTRSSASSPSWTTSAPGPEEPNPCSTEPEMDDALCPPILIESFSFLPTAVFCLLPLHGSPQPASVCVSPWTRDRNPVPLRSLRRSGPFPWPPHSNGCLYFFTPLSSPPTIRYRFVSNRPRASVARALKSRPCVCPEPRPPPSLVRRRDRRPPMFAARVTHHSFSPHSSLLLLPRPVLPYKHVLCPSPGPVLLATLGPSDSPPLL